MQMKQSLVQYAQKVPINVIVLPFEELIEQAVEKHNRTQIKHYNYKAIVRDSTSNQYVNHVVVNYIRHTLTNYDFLVNGMRVRVGRQKAKIPAQIIKKRTNELIMEKWALRGC